jgi:protein-S-isoprenylcysteine O-methyltransferase Ste14
LAANADSWSSVARHAQSPVDDLAPGFFAGYVPWRFFGLGWAQLDRFRAVHLLGLLCIGLGAALLAACIFEFARSGRGTLSPVDPPRQLVVRGLYRYVRNPMYLSVTTIVLGEALLTQSRSLAVYWAIWFWGRICLSSVMRSRRFVGALVRRTTSTLNRLDAGFRDFAPVRFPAESVWIPRDERVDQRPNTVCRRRQPARTSGYWADSRVA